MGFVEVDVLEGPLAGWEGGCEEISAAWEIDSDGCEEGEEVLTF